MCPDFYMTINTPLTAGYYTSHWSITIAKESVLSCWMEVCQYYEADADPQRAGTLAGNASAKEVAW
jgi:hypothetical protein